MELRFEHGNFDDARIVRTRVFMEEQGFQDEFDDIDDDPRTIHVTLYDANALVGCARTFPDPDRPDQPGRWVFGRLAVLPEARRGGFGAALLAAEAAPRAGEPGDGEAFDFDALRTFEFVTREVECQKCANHCEIICVYRDKDIIDSWGNRCDKGAVKTTA